MAGGTGFIGEPLVRELAKLGDVVVLSRDPSRVRAGRGVQWDPRDRSGSWKQEVADADVIVNLAGENIGSGRWTKARKERLVSSRLDATGALVDVIRESPLSGRLLINTSAVGYYGSRGDEILEENSGSGADFLADLCRKWEAAARHAEDRARVVLLRFGVVLGPGGGALQKMSLPFRFFAGGRIGNGHQWLSWIDRVDVIRLVRWCVETATVRGVLNATAPHPVRNRDFSSMIGAVMHRPSFMPTPAPMLELALGEMARGMLLASQRAVPRRLEGLGFTFQYPQVRASLEKAFSRGAHEAPPDRS